MNLWATVLQASVYSVVSITVGLLWKRSIKRERERIERVLTGVEAVFGIVTPTLSKKDTMTSIDLKRFRKAFAAGFGIILIGLLTWASGDGVLAGLLEPIVPDTFKPLIGVLVGGIATVVAVIRATNAPNAAEVEAELPAAATTPAREYTTANTSETSIVPLLPAPEPSYL